MMIIDFLPAKKEDYSACHAVLSGALTHDHYIKG